MTQQTGKQTQKQTLKKYLVFALMIAAFLVCMWLIFAPSDRERQAELEGIGFNADIPDPRGDGIVGDKKTAYEQEQMRLKREEKMRSLEDYSYMLERQEETPEERAAREERQLRMAPVPPDYQEDLNEGRIVRSGGTTRRVSSFEASSTAYHDINRTLGSFYEEPEVDEEKEQLKDEVENLRNRIAEKENAQMTIDDQLALLERSYELAARYNGTGQTGQVPPQQPQPATAEGRKTRVTPVTHVTESVVTSLSGPVSDREFLEQMTGRRNTGFNTVAAEEEIIDKNTVSAVIHGDQVLVDGQSVRLRTTEAIRAGKFTIPRNTIITGITKIGGDRLGISVTSIEYEGNIIPVELEAYDSDGQPGIYIPGSMEIAAFKEIAGNMGQNLGTTINLNQQSAGEQLLTDLGRGAIQGTSQYIAKKARQVKVTLKSGYRLFLLPGENS